MQEYSQFAEKLSEDGKQKTKVIRHLVLVRNDAEREYYRSIFRQELQRANMSGRTSVSVI